MAQGFYQGSLDSYFVFMCMTLLRICVSRQIHFQITLHLSSGHIVVSFKLCLGYVVISTAFAISVCLPWQLCVSPMKRLHILRNFSFSVFLDNKQPVTTSGHVALGQCESRFTQDLHCNLHGPLPNVSHCVWGKKVLERKYCVRTFLYNPHVK